jgi:hypothetical protein
MLNFSKSKVGFGLLVLMLGVVLAARFGTTSSILIVACATIALFAATVFYSLTK